MKKTVILALYLLIAGVQAQDSLTNSCDADKLTEQDKYYPVNYHSKLYREWREEMCELDPYYPYQEDTAEQKPDLPEIKGICDNPASDLCLFAIKVCDNEKCKANIIKNNITDNVLSYYGLTITLGYLDKMFEANDTEGVTGIMENLGSFFKDMEDAPGWDMIFHATEYGKKDILSLLLSNMHLDPDYIINYDYPDNKELRWSRYSKNIPLKVTPLQYAEEKIQEARRNHNSETVKIYTDIVRLLKQYGASERIPYDAKEQLD